MSFRWGHCKPMYDSSVYINADVEFDTVLPFASSFDPDIIPDATVACTET
ncbi:MAG: hypothetical protein LN364_04285 [Candidatus Thermoplasmatota archaeon]|nr:hypothetical protein [Candidatus Thermoplasmatota archaeon]